MGKDKKILELLYELCLPICCFFFNLPSRFNQMRRFQCFDKPPQGLQAQIFVHKNSLSIVHDEGQPTAEKTQ